MGCTYVIVDHASSLEIMRLLLEQRIIFNLPISKETTLKKQVRDKNKVFTYLKDY